MAIPVGVIAGLLWGRDLAGVRDLRVRFWGLLLPAMALGTVMWFDREPPFETLVLPLSLVLFGIVAAANLNLVGMSVVLVGIVANLIPIMVNGAMPVRESAIVDAGITSVEGLEYVELGAGRRFEEPDDVLMPLAAIVPADALNEVLTFGDLIVAIGLLNVGLRIGKPRRQAEMEADPNAETFVDLRDPTPDVSEIPDFVRLGAASVQPLDELPTEVQGSAYWDS
ncbi:MAG: DUF5317 domain-containing protein [Actinomycetia bacterium]|nr:DUF5317 domain-containing protein [Actinomycetes bacterium]MCP4960736.1 DUF5317 domain-containing protein [Actinomycetes bacterium]